MQGLADNYEYALRHMEEALRDCPDRLWTTDLWPDEAPAGPSRDGGLRGSAPWYLAHHALLHLDYDIGGGFEPWQPAPPFDECVGANPTRVFTKQELLGYVDWCRTRVRATLDSLTEERAARPLPKSHRYTGTLYGATVAIIPLHVLEHAEQIRQFLTAAGVKPKAGDATQFQIEMLTRAVTDATDDEILMWCGNFGGIASIISMVFQGMRAIQQPSGDCQVGWNLGTGIEYVFTNEGGKNSAAKRKTNKAPCVVAMSAPDFLRYVCRQLPMAEGIPAGRITVTGDIRELQRMYGVPAEPARA